MLGVSIFEGAKENNYPFSMEVVITGKFTLAKKEPDDVVKRLLEVNALAILFPYLRALVSTFTANMNVAPLILPTINVVQYLKDAEEVKE